MQGAKLVCFACNLAKDDILNFCDSVESREVENTKKSIENGSLKVTKYSIEKGETLWEVAKSLISTDNVDIREVVYQIKLINKSQGINVNVLEEGQTILIPENIESLV